MKIAFLNDGAYAYASGAASAVGGSERDQWLLGISLARSGWDVVAGVREGLAPGERRSINGVQFVGIDRGHVLVAWYRFLCSERPDWFYWEGATHLWGPAVALAKLAGVRTAFALALDREVQPRRALVRRPRWWPLYAMGLSGSDRILAQHDGQVSGLPRRWRAKTSILPKVCVLPGILSESAAAPHQSREAYVAWVAMLRKHKRPDVLVEIARRAPEIRFVVCGGASTFLTPPGYCERVMSDLRALPNVDYLGRVAPQQAEAIIANAAVLLSTSDEEGFPNTFSQAWSSGTPVVSLAIDPDDIIKRFGLGAVSGTVDRAVADIRALLHSPHTRDEMARRARRFIDEHNSAPQVVAVFERALQGTA